MKDVIAWLIKYETTGFVRAKKGRDTEQKATIACVVCTVVWDATCALLFDETTNKQATLRVSPAVEENSNLID